jgi:hypothetical protein
MLVAYRAADECAANEIGRIIGLPVDGERKRGTSGDQAGNENSHHGA